MFLGRRETFANEVTRLQQEVRDCKQSKVDYVKGTMVEMNHLRDYVKVLQGRIEQIEEEEDRQSIAGKTTFQGFMSYFGGS